MTKKSFLAELSCREMFLSLLDFITVVINFHNGNSNRGGKVSFNFLIERETAEKLVYK